MVNEICSLLPADQDNFYKYNSTLSRPRVLFLPIFPLSLCPPPVVTALP